VTALEAGTIARDTSPRAGRLPGRFILRRLAQGLLVLLAVTVANFCLLHALPGDVVDVLAGEANAIDLGYMTALREKFGLDQPLWLQLLRYLGQVVLFDLGYSFRFNEPVLDLILARLPATLLLMTSSILLAALLGLVLGVTAARFTNRIPDRLIAVFSLLAYATPVFWIGLMLIVAFAIELPWLPSGGFMTIGADHGPVGIVLDVMRHLILPTITLSFFYMALYTRIVRASMLEVLQLDFVRAARARGVSPRRAAFAHALPNAILPMVTMVGIQIGHMLGAAVLVETVFGWPGMGRLAVDAVFQRDVNLLLGILLLSSALVVLVNLAVDLIHAWLDPRIELG
jgi:peptide/nickel transport system permease protein